MNLEEIGWPALKKDKKIEPVTQQEVSDEIKFKVKRKKAPGLDLIAGNILKELPGRAIGKLVSIFNAVFEFKHVPSAWKKAEVILIPKPGKDLTQASSYRPISLLANIGKLWERLYLKRLKPLLSETHIIPDHQFGFREKHSTIQQVHRVVNAIENALEKKEYCSAVFLDVKQAFDRVWHEGLLFKIRGILPGNHFNLLKSYLLDREFRVRFGSAYSNFKPILAGVPQGSVLSPTLYNIFTSDLPTSEQAITGTFADDTAVLATAENLPTANSKVQFDIDRKLDWARAWRIAFNGPKSVHVIFTNRGIVYIPIIMNGQPIPYADNAKYLGLTLDAKLRWKHHVKIKRQQLNAKLKRMQWMLGPSSTLSQSNKVLLYKQVLRPIWAYGCELWGCTRKSNRYLIEAFQSKTLRLISGAPWFIRNEVIRKELNCEEVSEIIQRSAERHEMRLSTHSNASARELLNNNNTPRRLKRRKPFELV